MKIALIQFEPRLKKVEKNIKNMIEIIYSTDADLIIFPELSTSGYLFQNRTELIEFAFKIDSKEIVNFKNIAKNLNKAIIFGFPEIDGNNIYNSSVLILPDSEEFFIYRKTHLFFKERFIFDEGNLGFNNFYWKAKDIYIGMMICYDWRFPESARTLALKGADLIVCPSNLVTDVWHISMPSRALENKVYFAVSNRIGTESNGDDSLLFKGESAIWSFNGSLISKASKDNFEIIYGEIEPNKTRDKSFNPFNDIFNDRRPEYYI